MLEFEHPMLINVMIGSPSGVNEARDAIQIAIEEWNIRHGSDNAVVLMPYRWENRAAPIIGQGTAQAVINSALLERCHVMFAVFHHRFGTPTVRFNAGTEEEVQEALGRGMRVHLLFSAEPGDVDKIDPAQLQLVRDYRAKMLPTGVVSEFHSVQELNSVVQLCLTEDVRYFKASFRQAVAGQDGAALRVSFDSQNNRITIRNDSSEKVERLTVNNVTVGGATSTVSNSGVAVALRAGESWTYDFFAPPPPKAEIIVEISWRGQNGRTHRVSLRL